MRKLFILAFIGNVVLTMVSIVVLPDRVAIHFGSDGLADGSQGLRVQVEHDGQGFLPPVRPSDVGVG